jgi:hypothetical protein
LGHAITPTSAAAAAAKISGLIERHAPLTAPPRPVGFAANSLSVYFARLPVMRNAASRAATAGNTFREVARTTENATNKSLAEGLTALAEAIRELDARK